MTGDIRTANCILYGTPESPFKDQQPENVNFEDVSNTLKLKKPFTVELGNCSPYIVAPGKWSERELYRHARVSL